jgi:hypothetical protein
MMTDLEEQLRRELTDIAQGAQPESIRPLRVSPKRRRSRTVRWLAPIAAAAAVAGLIVGATITGRATGQQPAGPGAAGMPRYYVAIAAVTRHNVTVMTATVHISATGATVAAVQLPGFKSDYAPALAGLAPGEWITAAASDRLFVISDPDGLYALRLAANGAPEPLRKLSLKTSANERSDGGSLSPDGKLLALFTSCFTSKRNCPDGVVVFSLATGVSRTWLATHGGLTFPLNWTADSRKLFILTSRLLTVAGPGGSLLAHSVPIASPANLRGWSLTSGEVITPNGRSVISGDYRPAPGPISSSKWYRSRLLEFSAATGRLQKVLYSWGPTHTFLFFPEVESLAPSGLNALVYSNGLGFGRLDGSHFTPLPGLEAAW